MNIMDLTSIEEVLEFLETISTAFAEYATFLVERSDFNYDFVNRESSALYLEDEEDLYLICKNDQWTQIRKRGGSFTAGRDTLYSNAIYISAHRQYMIVVGFDFYYTTNTKKEIPPL